MVFYFFFSHLVGLLCWVLALGSLFLIFFFLFMSQIKSLYIVNLSCVQLDSLFLSLHPWLAPCLMTVDTASHDHQLQLMFLTECRVIAMTGTCQRWVISAEQWLLDCGFASGARRNGEQLSSGRDPCWYPVDAIHADIQWTRSVLTASLDNSNRNNFLGFTGRFGAWLSEISV